jgi:hypothetical protein
MASNRVVENKEQETTKVEKLRGSRPSSSSGKEKTSKSAKESWYKIAMSDTQEQEASRSMFKGSKSSKKGPNEMAEIAFVSEGATNQVD